MCVLVGVEKYRGWYMCEGGGGYESVDGVKFFLLSLCV